MNSETLGAPQDPGGASEGTVIRIGCQLLVAVIVVLLIAWAWKAWRG